MLEEWKRKIKAWSEDLYGYFWADDPKRKKPSNKSETGMLFKICLLFAGTSHQAKEAKRIVDAVKVIADDQDIDPEDHKAMAKWLTAPSSADLPGSSKIDLQAVLDKLAENDSEDDDSDSASVDSDDSSMLSSTTTEEEEFRRLLKRVTKNFLNQNPHPKSVAKGLSVLPAKEHQYVQDAFNHRGKKDASLRAYAKATDANYHLRQALLVIGFLVLGVIIAGLIFLNPLMALILPVVPLLLVAGVPTVLAYKILGGVLLSINFFKLVYSYYYAKTHNHKSGKDKFLKVVPDTISTLFKFGSYSVYLVLGGVGIGLVPAMPLIGLLPGLLFIAAALVDVFKEALKFHQSRYRDDVTESPEARIRREVYHRSKGQLLALKIAIALLIVVLTALWSFIPLAPVAMAIGLIGVFVVAPLLRWGIAKWIRSRAAKRQKALLMQLKDDFHMPRKLNRADKAKYTSAITVAKRTKRKHTPFSPHRQTPTLVTWIGSLRQIQGDEEAAKDFSEKIIDKVKAILDNKDEGVLDPSTSHGKRELSPWLTLLINYQQGIYDGSFLQKETARKVLEHFEQRLLILMREAIDRRDLREVKRLLKLGVSPNTVMKESEGGERETIFAYIRNLYYTPSHGSSVTQEYRYFYRVIKSAREEKARNKRHKLIGFLSVSSIASLALTVILLSVFSEYRTPLFEWIGNFSIVVDFIFLGSLGLLAEAISFAYQARQLYKQELPRQRKYVRFAWLGVHSICRVSANIALLAGSGIGFAVLMTAAAAVSLVEDVIKYVQLQKHIATLSKQDVGDYQPQDRVNNQILNAHKARELKQRIAVKALFLVAAIVLTIVIIAMPVTILGLAIAVAGCLAVAIARKLIIARIHKHHEAKAADEIGQAYKVEEPSVNRRLDFGQETALTPQQQHAQIDFGLPKGMDTINFLQEQVMLEQILMSQPEPCKVQITEEGKRVTQLDDSRITWGAKQARIQGDNLGSFTKSIRLVLKVGCHLAQQQTPDVDTPMVRIRGDLSLEQRQAWQQACRDFGVKDVTHMTAAEIEDYAAGPATPENSSYRASRPGFFRHAA